MTEETKHYKELYEQGIQIIDAIEKQNDGLQLLIQDLEKEPIKFADWICKRGYDSVNIAISPTWKQGIGDKTFSTDELYGKYLSQTAAGCSAKNNGA